MPREHGLEVVDLFLLGVVVELDLGPSVEASLYERIDGTPRHLLPPDKGRAVFGKDKVAIEVIITGSVSLFVLKNIGVSHDNLANCKIALNGFCVPTTATSTTADTPTSTSTTTTGTTPSDTSIIF